MGSVCTGTKVWIIGEGATVLVPEFLLDTVEVILVAFFCCCGGEDILVADAAISGGLGIIEEADGVFAFGKSSPNESLNIMVAD